MKLRWATSLLFGLFVFCAAAEARAEQVMYMGPHPLGASPSDGYCFIEVPHVHVTAPPPKVRVLYQVNHGEYDFVGDPVPFGYEGPKYAYYGHHPVRVDYYDDGPHDPVF